jgi:hypothetical protein
LNGEHRICTNLQSWIAERPHSIKRGASPAATSRDDRRACAGYNFRRRTSLQWKRTMVVTLLQTALLVALPFTLRRQMARPATAA